MTALERIEQSNMWHPKYRLPLSPQNNNPWFYMAVATKLIRYHDGEIPFEYGFQLMGYLKSCEDDEKPGLFDRWPVQSDFDITSHDELIGIAYLNSGAAERILHYLERHDGNYDNSKVISLSTVEHDLTRFVWFMSYLKARAGRELSLISQLKYAIHVMYDMATVRSGDASGRLLIWVMNEEMERYPLCAPVITAWRLQMKTLGIFPQDILKLEPKENPILSEIAPEFF